MRELILKEMQSREEELTNRRNLWNQVIEAGGPKGITPGLLRQLRAMVVLKVFGSIRHVQANLRKTLEVLR